MPPPTAADIYGPLLIGVFFNTILYGVVVIQCFAYYRTYRRDASWIRYFVLYLFVLETLNTGFNIGMMYEPLVMNYGSVHSLMYTPTMLILDPVVTALISTSSQFFIAWRIKVISGSIILPLLVCALAFASFGGATALTVLVAIGPEFMHLREYKPAIITWLVASACADFLITIVLSWSLTKRKTGVKVTDDKIAQIIRLTVHTGLLTSVLALADAVVFLAVPDTTLNFIWDFPLAKIYAISLLSTLNARATAGTVSQQTTSTANDNNVLFGRMKSHWKSHSRSEATRVATNRGDIVELGDESKMFSQHRSMMYGVSTNGGVTVTTVVQSMGGVHEDLRDVKVASEIESQ